MISDIIACLALYQFFSTIYHNTETAIDAFQTYSEADSESLDDWEPESEGGITLQCSTPSPHPTFPSRAETPEVTVQVTITTDNYQHLISKKTSLSPVRPIRLTDLTHRTSIAN